MNELNKKINIIVNLMNANTPRKNYAPAIIDLGKSLEERLAEIHYDPTSIRRPSIHFHSAPDNSSGMLEKMKEIQNKLFEFLEVYNIGFIRDFYVSNYGVLYCKIILQFKKNFTTNKPSNDYNYQLQEDRLVRYGFELIEEHKSSKLFACTENNISLFKKLLASIGGDGLEFCTEHDEQDSLEAVKVYFNIEKLMEFKEDCQKISFPKEEVLNPDEISELYDRLKDINKITMYEYSELNTSEIMNLAGNIAQMAFAGICEQLNIHTPETDKMITEWKKSRQEQESIRNKELEKASEISIEDFSQRAYSLKKDIDKFLQEKLNAHVKDFELAPYALTVNCSTLIGDWTLDELPEDQYFKDSFDMVSDANRDEYTFMMQPTPKNFEAIRQILKEKFGDVEVVDIKVSTKKRDYVNVYDLFINEFSFKIYTLTN